MPGRLFTCCPTVALALSCRDSAALLVLIPAACHPFVAAGAGERERGGGPGGGGEALGDDSWWPCRVRAAAKLSRRCCCHLSSHHITPVSLIPTSPSISAFVVAGGVWRGADAAAGNHATGGRGPDVSGGSVAVDLRAHPVLPAATQLALLQFLAHNCHVLRRVCSNLPSPLAPPLPPGMWCWRGRPAPWPSAACSTRCASGSRRSTHPQVCSSAGCKNARGRIMEFISNSCCRSPCSCMRLGNGQLWPCWPAGLRHSPWLNASTCCHLPWLCRGGRGGGL